MRKFRKFHILIAVAIAVAVMIGTAVFTDKTDKDKTLEPVNFGSSQAYYERGKGSLVRTILEVQGLSYEISVPEGSTVYDLMVLADSQYDNFSFKGREFPGLGFFVEEINGLAQDKEAGNYWIYYVNGKKAPVGVSQYNVQENDVITWKYEKEH